MARFTKFEGDPVRALKISKTGALHYCIWHDNLGNDYVQIVGNFGGKGRGQGSFSEDLFKVDDIGSTKILVGYDPISGVAKQTSDNNMRAFLKAVKQDLSARIEANEKGENETL